MTSRRDFIRTTALGLGSAALLGRGASVARPETSTPARTGGVLLKGPLFNQDSTEFYYTRTAEQVSGEAVDAWVDSLDQAGVGTLVSNVNAMKANYASRVWEPDWSGYDPKGPDDQPVLKYDVESGVAGTRRRLESCKRLADLGINFHERAFARCRSHGIGCWASIRMNDLHDCHLTDSALLSSFYKEQRAAGKVRVPYRFSSWPDRALDWARPEVRDHYLKLVKEVLGFQGLEGLELDWMRFGWHFQIGRELEGGEILTQWLAQVRKLCQERPAAAGGPVRLGCRVPSTPETARMLGMDGARWARSGLIDLLVPTPFWGTCEFNMPTRTWRQLLDGTGCALAGGLEIRYQPWPGAAAPLMSPELALGAAAAVLAGGADFVYLFNYFADMHLGGHWTKQQYDRTLAAMHSLPELDKLPRRHAVTYRDIVAPGEPYSPPLPAGGDRCTFRLQTGPKPSGGKVELLLELEAPAQGELVAPQARVNSVMCAAPAHEGKAVFLYPVPPEALAEEETVVEVTGSGMRIVRVEVAVSP